MRKVIIFNNVTLDGVMQGPASPTEDPSDDFKDGGWAAPYGAMQSEEVGDSIPQGSALLMGRRTYDDFYGFWPKQQNNPMTDRLNAMQKYVASRTLEAPLDWENTTLLKGDAAQTVADLKQQDGPDLLMMGGGNLAQTLMQHNLVDRYVLLIHPIVLGHGHKIFEEGTKLAGLKLIRAQPTPNGVIVAVYEPSNEQPK